MKKVLSMLIAAMMVVSASSTLMFAKTTGQTSTDIRDSGPVIDNPTGDVAAIIPDQVFLTVENREYSANLSKNTECQDDAALYKALNGTSFKNVLINGKYYNVKLKHTTAGLQLMLDPAVGVGNQNVAFSVSVRGTAKNALGVSIGSNYLLNLGQGTIAASTNSLNGDIAANMTMENINVRLSDIIRYNPRTSEPMALVEKNSGAMDGDSNGGDGLRGAKTLYFEITNDAGLRFDDDSYWKLRVSKGTNGKYIKKISDITKIFSKNLYDLDGNVVPETGGGVRHRYIKVEMNDIYTDDEYKITLDLRLTPRQKAVDVYGVDDDAEIKLKDFHFYYKNAERNADSEWRVGINGLMLNPLENDWNEVTYYDENKDVAFMKFFADSDVGKFYAKLSTKWEHADYASYFNDQDSFIFDFTGSPKISSTSRCDLQIYNPFIDEDGNETLDPTTAVIYQVIDGDLYDVTSSFTYEEGDNGDMAFVCRTRFLGTYIICEKPVSEAL